MTSPDEFAAALLGLLVPALALLVVVLAFVAGVFLEAGSELASWIVRRIRVRRSARRESSRVAL